MAYSFVPWTAATKCTTGCGSGTSALLRVILKRHPKGRSLGCFNCRPTRGASNLSKHGEGRALDVGFTMVKGRGSAEGYALVKDIGEHGKALGVEAIIYDRKIWSAKSPGGRAYTGAAPHYDHVHIELSRSAAGSLTDAKIVKILGGGTGAAAARKKARIAKIQRNIRIYQAKIAELQARIKRIGR